MAKICVPVCVRRIDELKTATQQAAGLGDMVELRLDCLEDPEGALDIVRELADQSGTDLIVTMGSAGIMTRVLGPSRGSFLTYGSIDDESGTAPGQITARDLRELYRIDQIDLQTQIFGIIGKPVGHSLSPRIHNTAFAAAGINAVYLPMEVQDAIAFRRRIADPKTRQMDRDLRGVSGTVPRNDAVTQCLDW